jgi:phospholipase C
MASSGSRHPGGPGPGAAGTSGGRSRASRLATAGMVLAAALTVPSSGAVLTGWATIGDDRTTTPIKHLVVLFQENVPFDRYFGVYPHALNPPGEPRLDPAPSTPTVDGLTQALLTANRNAATPHRLDRAQPNICGSNHGYTAEQRAVDQGRMDRFVQETGNHSPGCDPTLGMGYFDGNTVTAFWTYAQHYAIGDNSFGTIYGPSHLGVLNLVSGQTHGAFPTDRPAAWSTAP